MTIYEQIDFSRSLVWNFFNIRFCNPESDPGYFAEWKHRYEKGTEKFIAEMDKRSFEIFGMVTRHMSHHDSAFFRKPDEINVADGKLYFGNHPVLTHKSNIVSGWKYVSEHPRYIIRVPKLVKIRNPRTNKLEIIKRDEFVCGLDVLVEHSMWWLGFTKMKSTTLSDVGHQSFPETCFHTFEQVAYVLDNWNIETKGKEWYVCEEFE